MAITNSEEVSSAVLSQVGQGQKAVLVHFVRIARGESGFSRECELRNTIIDFLFLMLSLLCADFLRD